MKLFEKFDTFDLQGSKGTVVNWEYPSFNGRP